VRERWNGHRITTGLRRTETKCICFRATSKEAVSRPRIPARKCRGWGRIPSSQRVRNPVWPVPRGQWHGRPRPGGAA